MNSTEKLEMQVDEESDGSATVSLPEHMESPDDMEDTRGSNDNSGSDPDREAIRAARREERNLKKRFQKAKISESSHLINSLKRQNEQMAERLASLEKRSAGADVARVDKAIEEAEMRLQYAKNQIKQATEVADGSALANAQEIWYEARNQIEALNNLKKKVVSAPDPSSIPKAPDPRLKKNAEDWMARNNWYDPNGGDTDSQIAIKVDESMLKDGWDPTDPDYWEELDNRLTRYLPHHYNGGDGRSSNRRPRSMVTSSGRESSRVAGGNEFRLSPERVRAIKEAGRWENPAEREKMIRKYAEYDRMNRN
jgi:hypothetical protein